LLGHLDGVWSMRRFALVVWLPISLGMLVVWFWARRADDADFLRRARTGLVGGWLGTIGYDLVRIPFHLAGHNPFPPIRAYGVWLSGVPFSTPWTDLAGFLYHISNGITFGWLYSFLVLRRHWGWGVLWGLALETIAVSTAFGEVFRIRAAYSALSLAYAAHLFYGFPLGQVCRTPERWGRPGWAPRLVFFLLAAWFVAAWQPVGTQPPLRAGEMVIGPRALYPGWADRPLGSDWAISNRLSEPVTVKIRRPSRPLTETETITLGPGQRRVLRLTERGVYQLGLPDHPWRSVFISVHNDGDYRPDIAAANARR
ncbi:MAG: hypothetical protein HY600_01875, partial [Candidatus Omnitrophica bacterium]|nr:hypothetical protein [Candidatus Omnitrophota bacterium]